MPTSRHVRRLVSIPLIAFITTSHAQQITVPDAGALRQQIEPSQLPVLPPAQAPEPVVVVPGKDTAGQTTIRVTAFRFTGNTLLSDDQLTLVVASYLDRPLSFDDLQGAANAVAAAYRSADRLAQVSLPAQDITEGIVTLTIVEAQYGGMRFESSLSTRVKPAIIEGIFNAQQKVGQPLDAAALDRALLLADDLPGVGVAGTLAPGSEQGQTALLLKTTDELIVQGDISLDNTGARATGRTRAGASLQLNSPTGNAEVIAFNYLHSQGSDYTRAALTVPVGSNGLRVGANASYLTYEVVDGPGSNSNASIKGNSGSMAIDTLYPIIRKRSHNLYLTSAFEHKTFRNSDTQVRSDYATRSVRVGLSGNRFDTVGGAGANSGALQITSGKLIDMQAHSQLDSIARHYTKINYSLARQQSLSPVHSLLVSFSGQHATRSLDSSEKLYIGGAQSVRAYPISELGGDRGQALTAEWRWAMSPAWTLTTFADLARVVQLPLVSPEQKIARTLRGYGANVGWQGPKGSNTRLTWARRIGENPQRTATGKDGDGTLQRNRIWLSTALAF